MVIHSCRDKHNSRLTLAILVIACLSPAFTRGAPSSPACEAPEYRQFDFWRGTFEVRDADGQLAGHNRIEATADGCLLIEHWQGAEGGSGQSYNFYDPSRKQWRQLWVSSGAVIDIAGGLIAGETGPDSMLLEGEIHYRPDGRSAGFRGRWSPLADGTVRQFFEEQQADGSWSTWFEGFYHPITRKENANP